jgi:hypothetical protein
MFLWKDKAKSFLVDENELFHQLNDIFSYFYYSLNHHKTRMLIIVRSLEKLGYEGNIVRPFLTQRFKEYSKCAMVLIQLYIKKATNSKYIDNIMITRFLCI